MTLHMSYFDMLDKRYRSAARLGMNYASSTRGNRYVRTKVKREHAQMFKHES